jgi:hypothetical protein
VIERAVQLVDGLRPEGVAHLGPVEGDAHGAGVDGAVIGDVGEVEAGDRLPRGGVEDLGDHDPRFYLVPGAPGPGSLRKSCDGSTASRRVPGVASYNSRIPIERRYL